MTTTTKAIALPPGATARIDGVTVTLWFDHADHAQQEIVSYCDIERGRWSCSLNCALNVGEMTDGSEEWTTNEVGIRDETLRKIEKWALANGY